MCAGGGCKRLRDHLWNTAQRLPGPDVAHPEHIDLLHTQAPLSCLGWQWLCIRIWGKNDAELLKVNKEKSLLSGFTEGTAEYLSALGQADLLQDNSPPKLPFCTSRFVSR